MITILHAEIWFAFVLVAAVLATRRRLWLSLHVWFVAASSVLLLIFLYAKVDRGDGDWLIAVVVGMALKIVALCMLIVETIERQRSEQMGAANRENERVLVSAVQHLCANFGSDVAENRCEATGATETPERITKP